MVEIIRKGELPQPFEVPERLRQAAAAALSVTLREPRPAGFPLLFTADFELIEPAIAFLHEHGVQRAHTSDTVRTYSEILHDWFDTVEQNGIDWRAADATDLVAYRNLMLTEVSAHTGRPYSIRTINHRVRGTLRFYTWAVRNGWLRSSALATRATDAILARARYDRARWARKSDPDRSIFLLRQFESLPRPLTGAQACELLTRLRPPYDLMARWQLYTGLRVSELLRLMVADVSKRSKLQNSDDAPAHHVIDVLRKGRKSGYVIAPATLLDETDAYRSLHRHAWLKRAQRLRGASDRQTLFLNTRGSPVTRNWYQQQIARAGKGSGFKATTHLLRSTFACMMLARLEQIAKRGAPINPLLIVKVLMGHEHIDTTDRYLRAIAVETYVLNEILDSLLSARS
ncbi:MAG: tyrosine-type recombinase/integrase [Steroidobacteraceae bacterium]